MTARWTSCVAVVALAAFATDVFAQTPRSRSQRVDSLTSSIQGRVTTADTGAPIRGAEVRLSIDGRFNRLVTTDGEGRYEVRNLPAGAYKLIVSKAGFITLEFGQRRPFETASTITVAEGQSAAGNVALIRGGAIFGRVLDEFGDPSVGTRVQVLRARTEGNTRRLIPVGATDQTDDTGAFRVYGLPEGEYYVSASTGLIDAVKRDPPVYYPGTSNLDEAQSILLGAGTDTSADFQIAGTVRAATVAGVVLNSSGAPAPGAMINLSSNALSQTPGAQSLFMLHDDAASDGTFTIRNVPPGPYTLTAMLPPNTAAAALATAARNASRAATGGGPPPPLFQVPETASLPIMVTSEGLSGITLTTQRGGTVSGRFVADTGVVKPLPRGLQVALRSAAPGNMTMRVNGGNDDSDFQLTGSSGPARLDVAGVPEGWAVKAVLLDGEDVTDQPFDLTNKTGTIRVVMTDRPTSLSGIVQSTTGVRSSNVIVFADDASKWTSPSRFVRTVRTDANGQFRIQGLPAARYLAAAVTYLEDGEEQDRRLLERLRIRATEVTLGEGEQRAIQLDVTNR